MTNSSEQRSWRPYAVLAGGVIAVSSAAVFIRLAQQDNTPSLVIALWRMGLAALILTPIVLARHRADLAKLQREQIGLAVLSGLMLGVHFATWITSLEYTSVLTSVVLVTTNPLWVALASPLLLHERLNRATLIGILLAMAGGIVISAAGDAGTAPKQNAPLFGAFLAMVGSVAVAGYFIIGRRLRGSMALLPYIWLTYGTAALSLLVAVVVTRQPIGGLPADAYLWMTILALVPQLIGHSSYNYALGHLTAAYVSLTVLAEPIGSTILAVIVLHENPPGAWQLFGGLLILSALVMAGREEVRAAQRIRAQAIAT